MVERKMKKTGKRWINILAVFLAVCMCVTGIPFGELQVKAEGEQEGLAENEYVIHYDPNDGAGVKVGEDTLSDGVVYGFSKDETLTFALTQPEFWQDATPIVEIIIHSETEVIYRSDANEGDEHKINLTSGNTFEFTPGSETPFEVIIWWSEYDAFWGTEEKPVIVELDCTGNGTVNIEDIADTDKITYGNLTKVRIAENVNTLTLSWEGEAPREIRVENGSTYGELSEKTQETITLQITEEQFCRVEIDFNRGSAPALENNQYIVHYDPNGRAGVKVGENSLSDGVTYEFSTGDTLAFALTQPEFWPNATPIVEIIVHSEPEVIYRSDANEEDGYKIDLKDDNTFVFTPGSETPFEVNIWWSEYDTFWGTEEKPVIVELDCTGNGIVNIEDIADTDKITYGNLTKVRIAENVNTLTLSWEGEAPREIRVENGSTYGELSEKTQETITLQITEEQFCRVEIDFHGGNGDNPGPEDSQDLESYIESQQFAFGDWDEDENGTVNENDIKLGMAYQIYYPKLKNNQALQQEYGIIQYSDLISKITVNPDPTENLTATDAAGVSRTIPAYTYTVTLTKETDEGAETITATGTAYAFDFNDNSKYQQNNRGCVIAVTEKGDEKRYFLRCVNDYTNDGRDSDNTPMITGGNINEAPIVVVSDFDVIYDEQQKTYDRKVSIFGNGASLDTLLSQEEDTDVVAYQGRNEGLINDIGKGREWGNIFSIFTFCQKSFEGVQVQGSGATGSTPSWAYHQYPIFSTDDVATTEKEAVVYFGNTDVTIKPVDQLEELQDVVTGIESVTLADSNVPANAVTINPPAGSDTAWTVTFESDFYDQVKVKIVYTLQRGGTKTSYLNIHRVGIDILDGDGRTGMTLFHGTENGPTYNATGERVIWGTYYYPQEVTDSEKLVDLYVTYTWKDGSITKKTIPNSALLNMAPANGNCQSSDYILYDGTNEGAPTKIEAIAVVSGFDNTTSATFSGAKFGAGKGVVWNNYLGN